MVKRRLGIDIDGVLSDTIPSFLEFYHSISGKRFRKEDILDSHIDSFLGLSREESMELWKKYFESSYFDSLAPAPGACESLASLSLDCEFHIITSRPAWTENKSRIWIAKHLGSFDCKLKYAADFYSDGKTNKADVCKEIGIDVMLEDTHHYALACAEQGTYTLLFDNPWNKQFPNCQNLERVYSWKEAEKKIMQRL